ncbi:lamin tail domain-containing protein [candidate division KSB1 bacterium]|nr:lamin tail domain-containing protein [candidate division KSB1 bacterium]
MFRITWTILLFSPSLMAQVVLSEIMFNPWGEERDNEFVEIVNLDSLPVQIEGWIFSDGEQSTPIRGYDHSGFLQPKQYGLIFSPRYFANSTLYDSLISPAAALFVVESTQLGRNGLANSRAEPVSLFSAQGELIASYRYSVPNENGHSEEKRSLWGADSSINWGNSRIINGTPGRINSIAPPPFDLQIDSLKIYPQHPTRRDSCRLSIICQNRGSSPIDWMIISCSVERLPNHEIVSRQIASAQDLQLDFLQQSVQQMTFSPLLIGGYKIHLSIDYCESKIDTTIDLTIDAARGDVVINEVHLDDPPWIELYNTTNQTIESHDWEIGSDGLTSLRLEADLHLGPLEYAICATDSPAFSSQWTLQAPWIRPVPNFSSLSNTSNLVLRSAWGATIDSCVFLSHSGPVSLERIDPQVPGHVSENWIPCPHPAGGTCGERNAGSAPFADLAIEGPETTVSPLRPCRGDPLFLDYTVKSVGDLQSKPFSVLIGRIGSQPSEPTWFAEIRHPALSSGSSLTDRFTPPPPEPGVFNWIVEIRTEDAYCNNNRLLLSIRVGWAVGDVLINEVQYNTTDRLDEWIELYNPLDQTVDLGCWSVRDYVRTAVLDTFLLESHSFLVLTHRQLPNIPPEDQLIVNLPELNNSGDSIELQDADQNHIDLMSYDGEYSCTPEQSLERVRFNSPSNMALNWRCSIDSSGGTPGWYNSISPKNRDLAIRPDLSTWECPDPVAGNKGVWQIGIENAGLNSIDRFLLINEVYSPSQKKTVHSQTLQVERKIEPGETALFPWNWQPIQGGQFVLRTRLDCRDDDATNNDSYEHSIFISYSVSPLVINEILNNPVEYQTEAFEILNRSNETIFLQDWVFTDSDSTRLYALGDSLLCIPPQGFLVFSRDTIPKSFENTLFLTGKVFPTLSQQDGLFLIDANGLIADQTFFEHVLKGRSLERISPQIAADREENWAASVDSEGHTLGRVNSVYMPIEGTAVELTVKPPIFSPDGDGFDDVAAISFTLPEAVARVDLRIFDAKGRLIRYLLNHAECPAFSTILWDGKDENGQVCRIGIYIIHFRALDRQQSVIRQTVQPVVVAGKL